MRSGADSYRLFLDTMNQEVHVRFCKQLWGSFRKATKKMNEILIKLKLDPPSLKLWRDKLEGSKKDSTSPSWDIILAMKDWTRATVSILKCGEKLLVRLYEAERGLVNPCYEKGRKIIRNQTNVSQYIQRWLKSFISGLNDYALGRLTHFPDEEWGQNLHTLFNTKGNGGKSWSMCDHVCVMLFRWRLRIMATRRSGSARLCGGPYRLTIATRVVVPHRTAP